MDYRPAKLLRSRQARGLAAPLPRPYRHRSETLLRLLPGLPTAHRARELKQFHPLWQGLLSPGSRSEPQDSLPLRVPFS